MSPQFFYLISLHAFLVASILFGIYLFSAREKLLRAARWISMAGLVVHTLPLLRAHVSGQNSEFAGAASFYALMAWTLVLIYHAVRLRHEVAALGVITAPLATLFTLLAILASGEPTAATEAVRASPWVAVHVLVMTWGEGLFGIAAAAGALYLDQDWRLRNKRMSAQAHLPDLATLDTLGRRLIAYGFILLTLGLGIGVVSAISQDKTAMLTDPIALAFNGTWALYLILLLVRMAGKIGARKAAILSIACFGVALVTLIGINLIAAGTSILVHPN